MTDMVADGERTDGDLRVRVVGLERDHAAHVQRTLEIERWRTKTDIEDARKDVQWLGMQARLDSIDKNVAWAVRLVIGAIIAAVLTFMLKGGLNLPNI